MQQPTYDLAMRTHLEIGDCLLVGYPGKACGCGLVDMDGNLRVELARRYWLLHRDEILAAWTDDEPPYAATLFDAE